MAHDALLGLTAVLVIGAAAQWVGWRVGIPAILILLIAGFVAGPATGFVDPDELLGDLLFPIVSIAVAIILFEGGLSLKFTELTHSGRAVFSLVTVGVVLTGALAGFAAWAILGLSPEMAALLGAILTVTGPTVIGPLLRHIRPTGSGASVLKWEGILNDPIGAILAVLVFEAINTADGGASEFILSFIATIGIGTAIGLAGAGIMVLLLHRYWLPDYLHEVVALSLVVAVFTASDYAAAESGLLAATVMGVGMANQKYTPIRHIIEFKENLRVVLIGMLFVLLAARLELDQLADIGWLAAAFVAVLIFVIRPAVVFATTWRSGLDWRDKALVSWMAPRGIVAAAVTAAFALGLEEAGRPEGADLIPVMFAVIMGTVTVYGLTSPFVARRLGLASHLHEGLLIVGAHIWARQIAAAIKELDFRVVLIDSNRADIAAAVAEGFEAHYTSVVSDSVLDEIELSGIGKLLALTANDEVNALAALHFTEAFGRAGVYQLQCEPTPGVDSMISSELRGRLLFGQGQSFEDLDERFAAGAQVTSIRLSEEFTFQKLRERHGGRFIPLFLVVEDGEELEVFARDAGLRPREDDLVIGLLGQERKDAPAD